MLMLDRTLDLFERHKYGVIGTLMLHTFLLFALNISQVDGDVPPAPKDEVQVLMDFTPPPETQQQQENETEAGMQPVTNRASNSTADLSNAPPMSRAAQERMGKNVEEDLLAMEKEEFDKLAQERKEQGKEITVPQLDPSKFDKSNYMDKTPKPVKVEGLTTVSYDLKGRTDIILDVPAYLCKGSGKVTVRVAVDASGRVTKAELDASRTTTQDACMVDNALSSAGGARFSRSSTAPDPQRGTITYVFLSQ